MRISLALMRIFKTSIVAVVVPLLCYLQIYSSSDIASVNINSLPSESDNCRYTAANATQFCSSKETYRRKDSNLFQSHLTLSRMNQTLIILSRLTLDNFNLAKVRRFYSSQGVDGRAVIIELVKQFSRKMVCPSVQCL